MLDLLDIPTPWGSPFIGLGHLLQMALHVSNGHEQFLKWHEVYGPIVRLRLLYRDVVIVADPQVASELLGKGPNECPRRTPEYTLFNAAHGMPGYGAILTEQDEERWKAIRRAIAPAFTLSAVRDLFPTIVTCYSEVCKRISSGEAVHYSKPRSSSSSSSSSEPEVLIDEEIFAATLRVLSDGFLRMPQQGLFDAHKTAADASSLIAITNTFVTQPWKRWLYLGMPWLCKESRTFHAQRRHMMSVTHQIAQHIESLRPTASAADFSLGASLSRLREPSSGQLFSTQALQAEVFLEIVGQESVPWTVAWTLYLLTQHPEAEQAVLQELVAAGLPCNGDLAAVTAALSMDSLRQLPFLIAVLHEAMRLFPAGVAATPRMCEKVTKVGPYQVPAGVIVFPCLYSILNYSANWDSPQQFKPERWQDPSAATDPRTGSPRFVPFGIGPKACVAQQLAMVQCKVLLVLLLSCFSWRLAPRMGGPQGVLSQTVAALELRVAQGMWLTPTPRSAAAQ
ncbi:hypothetical protein OEZ86_005717 [Tetradesmus obliquus]|nr:hypothetical protein OEZ86_005717 [Tetradesmus obliquus]